MITKGLKALNNLNQPDYINNLFKKTSEVTTTATTTAETEATKANTKAILENTTAKQAQAATEQTSNITKTATITSTNANTTATTANTVAEQANAIVEKESVSAQALSVAGDQAETASLTANTAATVANTAAEKANIVAEQDALAAQWLSIGSDKAEVVSMITSTTATTANTVARQANTAAILTNIKALGKMMLVSPVGKIAALTAAIGLVIVAYDAFTVSIKEARDALDESYSAYENTTSELEGLQSQLEETKNKMSEIEADGSITLVEEGQYEELVKTNDELERTIQLKKTEQTLNASSAASDAVGLYDKYKEESVSQDRIDDIINNTDLNQAIVKTFDETNINETLAGYELIQEKIKEIEEDMAEAEDQATYDALERNLNYWETQLGNFNDRLSTILNDQQTIFDSISAKKELGITLSQKDREALDYATDALEIIDKYLNDIKSYDSLNVEGKRDRVAEYLQNSGASERSATKIANSLSEEDLELVGQIDFDEVHSEQSFYEALEKVRQEAAKEGNEVKIEATISDSVSQIATQLKPQFDELAEAYQNIFTDKGFTLDNVDNDMLEGLRSAFADLEEDLGVDFDTTELNRFFGVLTNGESTAEEVQQAFNDLATSYLYSTDTLENLNEETASAIEQQLEEMGVTNANEVVTAALTYKKNELAAANLYAAETGEVLANATDTDILKFAAEQIELGNLSQELARVLMQKINLNGTVIETEADINNLIQLAQYAGATADTLAMLNSVKSTYTTNLARSGGSETYAAHYASKQLAYEQKYGSAKEDSVYEYEPVKVNFDGNSMIDDASKAGKEAADEYLEAFEKEYELLNNLLDWGLITEKEYLDQLRALYEKYFKDREKYLEEYMKYEQEYLEGMRDLYNDVISYITDLLDDQIDAYEEQKDAAVDALEEQRDAAIEAYEAQKEAIEEQIEAAEKQKDALQDQIDAKQDEIDAINDAAEARQREIDLQKAQYELERARNQRTKFIYRDGQMVYEADPTAIRDAEEEVEDLEREKQIAAIEKEIELLEKQQDEIDDYIKSLEARQEEIDALIDSTNDYYDDLIASTEEYWDGLIEGLEEYKSRWEELADIEEQAKMVSTIEQLGFSTENILAMSAEEFERFKEQYLGLLSDLYSSNYSMLSSIGQVAGADMFGDITGYLEQTQGYIDSLNQIDLTNASAAITSVEEAFKNAAIGAGEAANMISGTGGTTTSASGELSSGSQGKGQEATAESSGGSGGSFKQAIEDATEGAVPLIGEVAGAFYGDEETSVTGSVEQAKTAIGTPGDSGSNSGSKSKGGKGEGEEGSDSLSGTLQSHVEYATSDEGIPAETQKFVELKDVLTEINELLTNIQTTLETLSSNTYEIKVSGIGSGLNFGGYATGVKNLKEKELAWTQEKGAEIIVSPTRNAILTPLEKGDSVINDKLTDNLLKWGTIDPSSLRVKQDYSVDFKNIPVDIQSNSNKDVAPNLTIDNVSFNCTGVTGEQVLRQIEGSFKGLFLNAYQQATTKK